MKALGTGIGAFALTDVEVRRTTGTGATRNAPFLVLPGAAAELAGAQGAGRFHLSLTHTDAVAIAFVVAEQAQPATCAAVLTRAEMRAPTRRPCQSVTHDTLVRRAGTAVAHAALRMLGGAYGRRVVVVAGKGSNGADGRVAAVRAGPARRAGPRARGRGRPGGGALPAVRPRDRRRLRHRVPGLLRRPGVPAGGGRAGRRHPLGRRRRHRRGAGRRGAGRPHGDLRRAQARPAPGRRADAERRASRWPTSASGSPTPQALLVEDADVGRAAAAPLPAGQQVDERRRRGGRLGRAWRVRPSCAAGAPWPPAPAWSGSGSPGDPVRGLADRGGAHAPAGRGVGRRRSSRPTAKCKAVVIGPGLGTGDRRGRGDPGRAGRRCRCRS